MQTGRLFLTVAWQPRECALGTPDTGNNSRVPEDTIYTNTELKKFCPVILCEFYESILKVSKLEEKVN